MRKLTTKIIRKLTQPGRYGDGGGLYLHIREGGSRQWLLRTVVKRKRTDIHLGSAQLVTLAEARDQAHTLRKVARSGGDPLFERRRQDGIPLFRDAAQTVWEQNKPGWRNTKHAQQWFNTIRDFAFPVIGSMRVDEITSAHMLKVLSPIWLAKPETAKRLKQRLNTVFDWAKASGYRTGDNPLEGVVDALPKQKTRQRHHKALEWKELPAFIGELQKREAVSALALQFIILTAARSGEVRGAFWKEIDWHDNIWTVPAERMKTGREHRVPLSPQAQSILKQCAGLSDNIIFPSHNARKPMSDMVFSALYKRMKQDGITTHGFRSTFRDWCSEYAEASEAVAEASLAHQVGNMTERAYARSDLLERRRKLMCDWADYAWGNASS